jgi:hypothetical protein
MEKNEKIRKITAENIGMLVDEAVKMDNLIKSKNIKLSYLSSKRLFYILANFKDHPKNKAKKVYRWKNQKYLLIRLSVLNMQKRLCLKQ